MANSRQMIQRDQKNPNAAFKEPGEKAADRNKSRALSMPPAHNILDVGKPPKPRPQPHP